MRGWKTYALVIALMTAASFSVAVAEEPARPWYADKLMAIGFRVFAKPEAAPDFLVESLSNARTRLSDYRGKVVLLNIWATWCPPCKAELPSIQTLWDKNKDRPFVVMAVSQGESRETVASFVSKNGYTFPVFFDPSGRSGDLYGARSIPTTCVIDKEGRLIAYTVGGREYDAPEIIAAFAELADK